MPAKRAAIDANDAINAYLAGEPLRKIARRMGVTNDPVRRVLVEAGVEIRDRNALPKSHRIPLDADAVIAAYRAGDAPASIGKRFGVSRAPIDRILRESGEPIRSPQEAFLPASLVGKDSEVVSLYASGATEKGIAEWFGTTRPTIKRILLRNGVTLRSMSDAIKLGQAKMTPEERAAMVKPAHDAVRGRPVPFDAKCRMALGRERAQNHRSPAEIILQQWLSEQGIDATPQKAIGPYNADLAIGSVAVEVFGGYWHAYGRHAKRTPERVKYILDHGWTLVIIWVCQPNYALSVEAANYVAALAKQSGCDPSLRGQYRVIWGNGEEVPADRLDVNDLSVIPPRDRPDQEWRRDTSTGRYT